MPATADEAVAQFRTSVAEYASTPDSDVRAAVEFVLKVYDADALGVAFGAAHVLTLDAAETTSVDDPGSGILQVEARDGESNTYAVASSDPDYYWRRTRHGRKFLQIRDAGHAAGVPFPQFGSVSA